MNFIIFEVLQIDMMAEKLKEKGPCQQRNLIAFQSIFEGLN